MCHNGLLHLRKIVSQSFSANSKGLVNGNTMLYEHLFVSMSVKQKLFVSVFVHKCLMVLNDVEYATFKMFVTQMSSYLDLSYFFSINVL